MPNSNQPPAPDSRGYALGCGTTRPAKAAPSQATRPRKFEHAVRRHLVFSARLSRKGASK